jgi:transposase
MILPPTIEEFTALQQALKTTLSQRDALVGECRVLRSERDLLQERLNKFMRKIFAARTEASSQTQKDLFFVFNEAEALGAQAEPAAQEDGVGADENGVDVPARKRARRGRKPLDAALPREVVRHELPEAERVCPHDGATLKEIGVEASEQLDIVPQQVRVIRHERVKYACPAAMAHCAWRPSPHKSFQSACSAKACWPG